MIMIQCIIAQPSWSEDEPHGLEWGDDDQVLERQEERLRAGQTKQSAIRQFLWRNH